MLTVQALAKRSMYYKLLRHKIILKFDDHPRWPIYLSFLDGALACCVPHAVQHGHL